MTDSWELSIDYLKTKEALLSANFRFQMTIFLSEFI